MMAAAQTAHRLDFFMRAQRFLHQQQSPGRQRLAFTPRVLPCLGSRVRRSGLLLLYQHDRHGGQMDDLAGDGTHQHAADIAKPARTDDDFIACLLE